MTKSYSIDFGGKTYSIDGPDDATKDQIEAAVKARIAKQSGNAIGDQASPAMGLVSGLAHGMATPVAEGMKMVGMQPPAYYRSVEATPPTTSRRIGEVVGETAPWLAARTAGLPATIGVGAASGALQPAKNWTERAENTAIGAGSSLVGPLGRLIPKGGMSALDHLASMAMGYLVGRGHGGGLGSFGGPIVGDMVERQIEKVTGGRGLASLAQWVAERYPGLAAEMGVHAAPYVGPPIKKAAESFVGENGSGQQ